MSAEPAPRPFVHLHLKSQFTLLGGVGSPKAIVKQAAKMGMTHLALTDEMNLFGAVEFYKACKGEGIAPVIGAELIVAPGSRLEKNKARDNHRLVALVRNHDGYVALNHLLSEGYLTGRHYLPRIDKEILEQHRELIGKGLIFLSGDLRGEVPKLLGQERFDEARSAALWLRDLVGEGNFYLELMDLGWGSSSGSFETGVDQRKVNEQLRILSEQTGIPLVVSNNVHYPRQQDSFLHEVLLCLGMSNTLDEEFRFRFPSDQFFMKSSDAMYSLFAGDEQGLANTTDIAGRCIFDFEFGNYRFPVYPHLDGRTPEQVLEQLAREGLEERMQIVRARTPEGEWEQVQSEYDARLVEELGIIDSMGFAAYFLIVYDFINWAKKKDIPVGPGRGSGAGSLVLYSLRITDIDPIPYNLLFERFLNPERVSMPDVDVDFCQDRRGEVIDYVNDAYGGATRVTQIITFGKMLAKGGLRDVGRVMGLSYGDVDRVAKLIPDQLGITLPEAIAREPRLVRAMEEDPRIERLVQLATGLEGTTRHSSVHAAGVVIADDDLRSYCPLYKGAGDSDPSVTQFDMKWAEEIGLIKFDFLGLKTLTMVKNALDMARAAGKCEWDFFSFNNVPLEDEGVYELLTKGDTLGVFQLESSGMRELLRGLQPTRFEDIIAVAALYRPGPMGMGMHHTFVECKHGRQQVTYPHPSLRSVLSDTYGVIVFQEQVMQIAQIMGGYSLGEADLLRRAMGKKKEEEMARQRVRFLAGAAEQDIEESTASTVFDLMAEFAKYGFNKSHTAAYGFIAYQTAWIKKHLPAEFFAALLTIESSNTDKVLLYMDDARKHDIEVLPPDVNESVLKFTVVGEKVRFGLTAVKGVGQGAVEAILEAREQCGGFKDLDDFVGAIDVSRVNKGVLEALVKCGAFDSMGYTRASLLPCADRLLEAARQKTRDRQSGQVGLFGAGHVGDVGRLNVPELPEWPERERLEKEKEALGLYITGHPMNAFAAEVETFATATTAELRELKVGAELRIAGVVGSMKVIVTKSKGERMAFVQLEDLLGSVELTVFPRTFAKVEHWLNTDVPLLVKAKLDEFTEDGGAKLLADDVQPLAEVRESQTREVCIELGVDDGSEERLDVLRALIERHPGNAPIRLTWKLPQESEVVVALPAQWKLQPSQEMLEEAEAVFGRRVTSFT
jgi:DNA polymerase III subunit alpha